MSFDNPAGNSAKKSNRGKIWGKPFQKGKSGNPSGRPKKSLMQREMEKIANDPKFMREWRKATEKRMVGVGVAGFLQSREIADRVDGPVAQQVELSGELAVSLADAIAKRREAEDE